MNIIEITAGISIIYDFLKHPEYMIDNLLRECELGPMTIRNKTLSRKGCFQGIPDLNGNMPWLRCPSIENQTIMPMSTSISYIHTFINNHFSHIVNIFKIQEYLNGEIIINSHSDKILDMELNVPIFIARFGATRTMELTNKITNEIITLDMPHNSLLCMSYDANLLWKHGIAADPSYSIVCRSSITYLHSRYALLYGERTPFKSINDLEKWIQCPNFMYMTRDQQRDEIVACYKKENYTHVNIGIYDNIICNAIYPY